MLTEEKMTDTVKRFLKNNNIHSRKIIVAVSGGPDSVFLLKILSDLRKKLSLDLMCAYVNHGIRSYEENQKDYLLVSRLCTCLKIELKVKVFPQGYLENKSKQEKTSLEAAARECRYKFFNELADETSLIAVAHNRDDQIETQIMRFFQGSSYEGLLGIRSLRDNIIRPIISLEKSDILEYLKTNNISYNIDTTNNDSDFLRNKVRNQLIPAINEIFPAYKKSLYKYELELLSIKDYLEARVVDLNWTFDNNIYYASYDQFISLSLLERKREIFRIFDLSYSGDKQSYRLPSRFLKPLEKELFKNKEIVLEGHGFRLVRNNTMLQWEPFIKKTKR